MLIQMSDVSKSFGERDLFSHLDFIVEGKEKIALVGLNGVGKTTLFKMLLGEMEIDKGQIFKQNKLTLGYLDQKAFLNDQSTVQLELDLALKPILDLKAQLTLLEEQMKTNHSPELLERYANLQYSFEMQNGYHIETETKMLLTRFGFAENDLSRKIDTFSGGQRTRLAFIRMLLSKPDVLLLDEPTNHLDIMTIEWLEGYMKSYDKAVIIVSHDRLFLDRVCDTVVELEHQKAFRYTGNYSSFVKQKEQNKARQEVMYNQQQKEIQRLEALIEKFRYKRSKAAFAQSKIKYLDRLERVDEVDKEKKTFKARFTTKVRGGKNVLLLNQLTIGYDQPLSTIDLEILRGQRIGIIGENGIGKSTLLKTIVGKVQPLAGEMLLGHQIEIGYFDQELNQFDPTKTVLEELWDEYPQLDKTAVRTILGQFLFSQEDVFKEVAVLSGGEKVRLALAKLLVKQANFLILDEPTNHLDIPAKEALEEALASFEGTLLFVSHDRYFIQKMANALLVFKKEGVHLNVLSDPKALIQETEAIAKNKETRHEQYKNTKALQREQERIEKKLEEFQVKLADHRELRYDPEYYHDNARMDQLDAMIDDIHNEIAHLEKRWEEIALIFEESEKEES